MADDAGSGAFGPGVQEESSLYKFVFLETRTLGRALMLQELMLYGESGQRIAIAEASNPSGVYNSWEGPEKAIDGVSQGTGSKWLDQAMATRGNSTLLLFLTEPQLVMSYELVRGQGSGFGRDPISWEFYRFLEAGGGGEPVTADTLSQAEGEWLLVDQRRNLRPPLTAFASYGFMPFHGGPVLSLFDGGGSLMTPGANILTTGGTSGSNAAAGDSGADAASDSSEVRDRHTPVLPRTVVLLPGPAHQRVCVSSSLAWAAEVPPCSAAHSLGACSRARSRRPCQVISTVSTFPLEPTTTGTTAGTLTSAGSAALATQGTSSNAASGLLPIGASSQAAEQPRSPPHGSKEVMRAPHGSTEVPRAPERIGRRLGRKRAPCSETLPRLWMMCACDALALASALFSIRRRLADVSQEHLPRVSSF